MLFFIAIFIGAFLLFQVQPLIAKVILPYFGGGAAVWTACLLFFQAFLLLGYLYAHLLSKIGDFKKQAILHVALLLISLWLLPIGVSSLDAVSAISNTENLPLMNVLLLLATAIGLPYFMLSSTGPLVQHWFSLVNEKKLPYKLYSLSNLASLIALLSFPFLIEPFFTGEQQSFYWSVMYFIYAVIMSVLLLKIKPLIHQSKNINTSEITNESEVINKTEANRTNKYSQIMPLLWLGFSTLGVVLLVSTTNALTQNVPPVPFLWILPLSLYLLSFIISFHSPKWYVRWYWFALFILTAFIALFMFFIGSQFDITSQVVIYSSILFSACMLCHGELARLKPDVAKLTFYYLTMAFGGFLGSVLVAFVAQNIFTQFLEFPLAIVSLFVLFSCAVFSENKHLDKLSIISFSLAILCGVALWQLNQLYIKTDVHSERNFYGILSVKDVNVDGQKERRLIDGTTSHGTQSLMPGAAHIPMSYYRENTGVAIVLEQLSLINKQNQQSLNVGFIGLGAGTLAAYGNKGDRYRFYELNPAVVHAAREYFSYLTDSKADVEIVIGDGRVSLSKELKAQSTGNFDVLVIDAFSGDSIPQHLLTVESMQLYWQHLAPNGVIAVHISNTHLNLLPLMQGLAQQSDKQLAYFKTKAQTENGHDTQWVWLTDNQSLLDNPVTKSYRTPITTNTNTVVWSDDFSHLLSVLK
ncbi:fused MFS/spermidine synthase [Thalassotalea castellviae]|uniref:Fused MFS/spermidine synthase n=1 Tax=Thalassotalea castellviae TaxID=3075612 RepID=A0ABU3A3H1_9GAMM|nr:fused MFS/spermidine synthase [Thalassotalea sp. W431]MDT0604719.1 fused MFS/spermidine synthase [Thalassotalea sp. W431]